MMMQQRNNVVMTTMVVAVLLGVLFVACREAFTIRCKALAIFGPVIHEFDPYFNYRATEYLWTHGWYRFTTWYDTMVWYPLGRPVGTTIYPGMQVTSVLIKRLVLPHWSLNDICCHVPVWFGVTATLAVALLTYECTRSAPSSSSSSSPSVLLTNASDDAPAADVSSTKQPQSEAAVKTNFESILNRLPMIQYLYRRIMRPFVALLLRRVARLTRSTWGLEPRPAVHVLGVIDVTALVCAVTAACFMAIVPAHLSRSIGGGYDNESVAMTAMVTTFALWTRALRDDVSSTTHTVMWAVMTGVAYFYMAAVWGGYVFVLNLIGLHVAVLVLVLGRYSTRLYRAYTAFYVVGTALAIQVPVIGWTPLRSLEQLGPFVVFAGMQLIYVVLLLIQNHETKTRKPMPTKKKLGLWIKAVGSAGILVVLVVALLVPTGYFGPISSRVRGLFVEHTKTGNPLVDSVAEHQPGTSEVYFQYLFHLIYLAPAGFLLTGLVFCNDSSSFLLVYGITAYYFSHRMMRLILLTAPIASALGGVAVGRVLAWGIAAMTDFPPVTAGTATPKIVVNGSTTSSKKAAKQKSAKWKDNKKANRKAKDLRDHLTSDLLVSPSRVPDLIARGLRVALVGYLLYHSRDAAREFYEYSHDMADQVSHPHFMREATLITGEDVIIDDYREAYFWLRDNTPDDSRIMAWWDYGYQITAIANRTTIADGNTWNHEHIALLGRALTGPVKEAHRMARHLADYILVWSSEEDGDLPKSQHIRRIANSVYRGLCSEPTCRDYGFDDDGQPTNTMAESLLFTLCLHDPESGIEVDRNRFKLSFESEYGLVRIFKVLKVSQDSKQWVLDNRVCDAPGSWMCRGQYPPALQAILQEKRDFKQLEDFNIKGDRSDEDYQRQYFENIPEGGADQILPWDGKKTEQSSVMSPHFTDTEIESFNANWEDTELTGIMYDVIANDRLDELKAYLKLLPHMAHVRSENGRGPMWWAYEFKRKKIAKRLRIEGVSETRTDRNGHTPLDASTFS